MNGVRAGKYIAHLMWKKFDDGGSVTVVENALMSREYGGSISIIILRQINLA
jgi:hypothetical protein